MQMEEGGRGTRVKIDAGWEGHVLIKKAHLEHFLGPDTALIHAFWEGGWRMEAVVTTW